MENEFDNIDYFPSFEIITQPGAGAKFYEDNLRSVTSRGVETVMRHFFSQHPAHAITSEHGNADGDVDETDADDLHDRRAKRKAGRQKSKDDLICEDALLEAFSK